MNAAVEIGGNLVTRFGLSVEKEQADAGWDVRTCRTRPNSQARTGTSGGKSFSTVQLTTWRIAENTCLIPILCSAESAARP